MNIHLLFGAGGVLVGTSGLIFEWVPSIQYLMLGYLILIGWLVPVETSGGGSRRISVVIAVAIVLLNLVGAIDPFDVLLRFLALYLAFLSITRVVAAGGGSVFTQWLILAVGVLSISALPNLEEWQGTGRLSWGEIHPNLLAMYGYVLGVGTVALLRNPLHRMLGALVAMGIITFYSSRAPLVALAIFCLVFYLLYKGTFRGMILLLFSALAVATVSFEWVSEVLLLDDEYRGVDSGLSGRVDYWRSALQLFYESPAVGVGYGQAEKFLGIPIDNGYLLLLAEGGITGAAAFLLLLGDFLRLTLRQIGDEFGKISLSLLISFCVYIMFERRYLAIGNPLSILMMVAYAGLLLRDRKSKGAVMMIQAVRT